MAEAREAARVSGLKVFHVGIPCSKGHLEGKRVSSGECYTCASLRDKAKYLEKRDEKLKKRAAYVAKNKEKIDAWQKDFREANRELLRERGRLNRLSRVTDVRERQREYYASNSASMRSKASKKRASRALRTAFFGAEHKAKTEAVSLAFQELSVKLTEKTGENFNVDHMIPLRNKLVCGLHVWNNLQLIPEDLNLGKGNKLVLTEPFEWVLALSNREILKSPAWCDEAEAYYRGIGWDFRKGAYVSGPYCSS